jgi:hypothetical protein
MRKEWTKQYFKGLACRYGLKGIYRELKPASKNKGHKHGRVKLGEIDKTFLGMN